MPGGCQKVLLSGCPSNGETYAGLALKLGSPKNIGHPFHLIEGTHRVSYLRRMIQRNLVARESIVEVIEVSE